MKKLLADTFSRLGEDVTLMVFTKKGMNDQLNEFTAGFISDLASIHKNMGAEFHEIGDEASRKYRIDRSPTVLISPGRYSIRYTGAPVGEEGRSLIFSILMVSTGETILSEESRKRLERLKEKRHVRVFVSPT